MFNLFRKKKPIHKDPECPQSPDYPDNHRQRKPIDTEPMEDVYAGPPSRVPFKCVYAGPDAMPADLSDDTPRNPLRDCPKCGATAKGNEKRCPKCGEKLPK